MIVLDGQSLIDVAIQCCGSAEAAYDIALLNNISITDDLTAGRELNIPTAVNATIVSYYTQKGIIPATGLTDTENFGGINYMGIEIDFIVS